MNMELTRFRVLPGKTDSVNEWMELLNSSLPAVHETLEQEKMYVETIFSESIDKARLGYWKECIDPDYAPQDLHPRVNMIAERIQ